MSALGQEWSFRPGRSNGGFAPKAVIRTRLAQWLLLTQGRRSLDSQSASVLGLVRPRL